MSKRTIELIRVSTEGQAAADRASIPAQKAANRRTAAIYGLEIIQTIQMSDVSGAAVLYAPEMQQLIELMRSPDIHGVVAKEFSRLMRPENFMDYGLLQHFADTNTVLYLPDGPLDLGSKMGRLMGGVRALFAGIEREEIRERVWAAKEEKRRRGENPQSDITLPFGVRYTREHGWFYTPEAEKVREAFRLFMAGEQSYNVIGQAVGIEPYNLRVILQNPIYCGWRVIDTRRDTSAAALRVRSDGRQGDRPKIRRAEEDVIRLKVIDDPLVSEADFHAVQYLINVKKTRHWRANPFYVSPYTYHGHLSCAVCGELVFSYTNKKGNQYYTCKAKQYPRVAGHKCQTPYMRRDVLEPRLDILLGERFADLGFLRALAAAYERKTHDPTAASTAERIRCEIKSLQQKRKRILEAFFDGVIPAIDRDSKISSVDGELQVQQGLLARQIPPSTLTLEMLVQLVSVFKEWEFLSTSQKRRILSVAVPDIRVADSQIHGITININSFPSQCEISHRGTDSWPRPA